MNHQGRTQGGFGRSADPQFFSWKNVVTQNDKLHKCTILQ